MGECEITTLEALLYDKYLTRNRNLHNQRESPLLQMPPEIRNMIYTYVFKGLNWRIYKTKWSIERLERRRNDLALLGTCRQISAETALLPFVLGRFDFRWFKFSTESGIGLFKTISAAQLGAIQSISRFYLSTTESELRRNLNILTVLPNLRCIELRHVLSSTLILLKDNLIKVAAQVGRSKRTLYLDWEIDATFITRQLEFYKPGREIIFMEQRRKSRLIPIHAY